jgi:hypothetical protein
VDVCGKGECQAQHRCWHANQAYDRNNAHTIKNGGVFNSTHILVHTFTLRVIHWKDGISKA